MVDPGTPPGGETRQRTFFREVERDYWAEADGLKPDERALICSRLALDGRTIEAGTGGGRLLLQMHALGFRDLRGFDFAPELVAEARRRDAAAAISLDVADATGLPYPDAFFDQALYLQQVLCTIESSAARAAALGEARRIVRPGGTLLFSFVCIEARRESRLERAYLAYLGLLRRLSRSRRPLQLMPRLKLRGRFNPGALIDRGPYTYWYGVTEAEQALAGAGLELLAIGDEDDAIANAMHPTTAALAASGAVNGTLYAVCRRPR